MCADYELLRHTPAEICAGSLLAAWRSTGLTGAIAQYLAPLAHGCSTTEVQLTVCANELLRYFQVNDSDCSRLTGIGASLTHVLALQVCFPDAA